MCVVDLVFIGEPIESYVRNNWIALYEKNHGGGHIGRVMYIIIINAVVADERCTLYTGCFF